MAVFHGYILIQKPTILTMAEWRTVLTALYRALNRVAGDPSPAKRLHYRVNLAKTAVIVEASFNTDELNINRLAQHISTALDGKYTPTQVKAAINSKVTVWGAGGGRAASGDLCRAYLKANAAAWEASD